MKKIVLLFVLVVSVVFALAQTDAPTVRGTVDAVAGGLTALPVDAAVANIEGWQTTLEGSDDPVVQGIVTKLGQLKDALQADTLQDAEISNLLTGLGADTLAVAKDAGDDQLTELGNLLLNAGTSLVDGATSGGAMSGGMMSGGMMSGGN